MATPSLHQLRLLRAVLMALPLLLTPITVRANLGPPWSGGQIVAEPVGIKDVEITRESLTIDLRPLAKNSVFRWKSFTTCTTMASRKSLPCYSPRGRRRWLTFRCGWATSQYPANLPKTHRSPPAGKRRSIRRASTTLGH